MIALVGEEYLGGVCKGQQKYAGHVMDGLVNFFLITKTKFISEVMKPILRHKRSNEDIRNLRRHVIEVNVKVLEGL